MMFTTPMKHIIAVVLDHDSDNVAKELISQGLLHFMSIRELHSPWRDKVQDVVPDTSGARIAEIKKRIESLLSITGTSVSKKDLDIEKLKPLDIDRTEKLLDDISGSIQGYRDRQKQFQQEILKLRDIKRQVNLFGDIGEGIKIHSAYSFLSIQTGSVPSSKAGDLSLAMKELPSVIIKLQEIDQHTHLLVISMKKDDSRVNRIFEQSGWLDMEITGDMQGVKEDVIGDLDVKCAVLEKEQDDLDKQAKSLIQDRTGELLDLWEICRLNELYSRVKSYFSKTARTILFSGFIPASKQKVLEESVKKITAQRCYLEWSNPVDRVKENIPSSEIPVELKNPKILSPFRMLVQNYAIPEYGSIDPTPFVAVAYFCMFGLMFGDVGQGIILVLCGIIGSLIYKSKDKGLFELSQLIIWCGISAIIFGILFGSYFGVALFKPVWFNYHGIITEHARGTGFVKDVYGILALTIYFGILVIGVGLIINCINLVAKRRWFSLFMDKGGLVGTWMYGAGVYTGWYFATHGYKELPNGYFLLFALGLPTFFFFFKAPIKFIKRKIHDPSISFTPLVPVDFFIEWFVELMEIVGGYLANTLSFMRVAGLGIAHVSLMFAFMKMAESAGTIAAIPILIFGNGLVIFLEGLSAGIQSLRLNYYEFFSKYFTGTGKAYSPVSLHSD
ncbi:MAG: ATPase V [Spirochaetales bacterium]|nr:ATPase V [Spirochaetales bacterium]